MQCDLQCDDSCFSVNVGWVYVWGALAAVNALSLALGYLLWNALHRSRLARSVLCCNTVHVVLSIGFGVSIALALVAFSTHVLEFWLLMVLACVQVIQFIGMV